MTRKMEAPVSRWYRIILVIILLVGTIAGYALPEERKIESLNFSNIEIPLVLKALADLSGANIAIGPQVKGTITIKLTDVTVDDALQIITKQAGLAYAVSNGVYVVNDPTTINTMFTTKQTVEVVKLKWIAASDITSALVTMFKDVQVTTLPNKQILLSGESKRVRQVTDLIQQLDVEPQAAPVNPLSETMEETYKVKAVVAWQAKGFLENMYGSRGLTVAFAPNNANLPTPDMPAAPVPSLLATTTPSTAPATTAPAAPTPAPIWQSDTLILRGPKGIVEAAIASLAKVDVEMKIVEERHNVKRVFATQAITYLLDRYESRGLVVYTLPMTFTSVSNQVGDAGANTAKAAFAAKTGQIGTQVHRDKDGKLNISEPIGDFTLRGPEAVVKDAATALAAVDVGPEQMVKVHSLRFLDAKEAQKKMDEMYSADGLQTFIAPPHRGGVMDIVTNTGSAAVNASNAESSGADIFDLVLRGPEAVVTRAEQMLTELDAEPAQISVQSEIISITSSAIKTLGVAWPGSVTSNLTEQQSGDPLQLGRILRDPVTLSLTLNALESKNKAKIISRPTTVVQNGRTSAIHVGDRVYYQVLSGFQNGTPIFSTSSLDTGVTMKVRPLMSKDGVITLEITTNVTDPPTFRKGSDGSDLPTIRESANTTVVQMHENETLVVGGLKQVSQAQVTQGVPFLSKIPLVGWLFKSNDSRPSDTEMLILVTPKVVSASTTIPADAAKLMKP